MQPSITLKGKTALSQFTKEMSFEDKRQLRKSMPFDLSEILPSDNFTSHRGVKKCSQSGYWKGSLTETTYTCAQVKETLIFIQHTPQRDRPPASSCNPPPLGEEPATPSKSGNIALHQGSWSEISKDWNFTSSYKWVVVGEEVLGLHCSFTG